MKKQSGFTLIELMVVMAIIAILATAGLSAYTGYLKKARDTTRIADLDAMNTIITGTMSGTGTPPLTAALATTAITAANNNIAMTDPLGTNVVACLASTVSTTATPCAYVYRLCDSSTGFAIGAKLESVSNQSLYRDDGIGYNDSLSNNASYGYQIFFEVGNCRAYDSVTLGATSTNFGYL